MTGEVYMHVFVVIFPFCTFTQFLRFPLTQRVTMSTKVMARYPFEFWETGLVLSWMQLQCSTLRTSVLPVSSNIS